VWVRASRALDDAFAMLGTHRHRSLAMPTNPQHPAPPIAQPGKQPPDEEIRNPGHARPQSDADPDPLDNPLESDDPLKLPPL
jgi:hypothetical protein